MMFLWIPFLILIPLGIFWLARGEGGVGCGMAHATHAGSHGAGGASAGSTEPTEIARQRLARGEITVEQYEEIRRLLG